MDETHMNFDATFYNGFEDRNTESGDKQVLRVSLLMQR